MSKAEIDVIFKKYGNELMLYSFLFCFFHIFFFHMKDRYNYGRIKVQGHRKKPHAIAKFVGGKVFKVKRGVY